MSDLDLRYGFDGGTFRDRIADASQRVLSRTGVDPLDVERSMAITTDLRLEKLPGSIGIGLGTMAAAGAVAVFGLFAGEGTAPGDATLWALVVLIGLLGLGSAACVVISRAAKERRPMNESYEDAWARFALEVWTAPRYQSFNGGSGGSFSRTEFLLAVRRGDDLVPFQRHAPFTRNP